MLKNYIKILNITCALIFISNNIYAMEESNNIVEKNKDNNFVVVKNDCAPQPILSSDILDNNNFNIINNNLVNEDIKDNEIKKLRMEIAQLKTDNTLYYFNKDLNPEKDYYQPKYYNYHDEYYDKHYSEDDKYYSYSGSANIISDYIRNSFNAAKQNLQARLDTIRSQENKLKEYVNNINIHKNLYKQLSKNLIDVPEIKESISEIINHLEIINKQVSEYKEWQNKINYINTLAKLEKYITSFLEDYDMLEKCIKEYNKPLPENNYKPNAPYKQIIEKIKKQEKLIYKIIRDKYEPMSDKYLANKAIVNINK